MNHNLFNYKPIGLLLVPIIAILFVIILILYKIFYKIRSQCNVLVNCWFCNKNFKILYISRNSWTCPECEQYNGFTKTGDYNKEIYEQFNCSNSSNKNNKFIKYNNNHLNLNSTFRNFANDVFNHNVSDNTDGEYEFPFNGFCNDCNENQRLKIEKLGQFEPKKESSFDKELEIYKKQLEEQYRLCSTCEHHLKKVLREKKKMVLGSKLLDFIVRGANNLQKHPKIRIFKKSKNMKLKLFISYILLLVSIINFLLIIHEATNFIYKGIGHELGDPFVRFILVCVSHILALCHIIQRYIQNIILNSFFEKLYLFTKTLTFILSQALGYKIPNINYNFNSTLLPFGSIFLTFLYNLLDGFQLSRYTILLTIWSANAFTTTSEAFQSAEIFKLITATAAIILSIPRWNHKEIDIDKSNYSFHKIYSENYYLNEDDEEDSISMLSSKLNQSSPSVRSFSTNTRNCPMKTSSTINLKCPSPSFQHFESGENNLHSGNNFAYKRNDINDNRFVFGSQIELSRPASVLNGSVHNLTFCCANANKNPSVNRTLSIQGDFNQHSSFLPPAPPFSTAHNGFIKQTTPSFISPYASPCSYTTNSVYNSRQNLLTPSRFGNEIPVNHCNTSWVSGGYFNAKSPTKSNCDKMNINNDNLSRASSQSSGFESTSSNNNRFLSEAEFPCESSDFRELDSTLIISGDRPAFQQASFNWGDTDRFQPICKRGYSIQPSNNFSKCSNGLNQNASLLTNLTNPLENRAFDWRGSQFRESSIMLNNSFNLDKINEELPSIKRGRLLQKWSEQNVS